MQETNVKKMGLVFYSAGRFEDLKADAGSTIDFIRANNTVVLPNQIDMAIIYALKASWYAIEPHNGNVTVEDFEKVHTNLLKPKKIHGLTNLEKTGARVAVKSDLLVSETLFTQKITEALAGTNNLHEKAARLFANIVKLHPFEIGNKRVASIVVNRLLLSDDEVLLIPDNASEYQIFMTKLASFSQGGLTLAEFGSYYGAYVRKLSDIEITRPFGKIIDLRSENTSAFKSI